MYRESFLGPLTTLWPPNHKLVSVGITNVSDPNNDQVAISITGVTQDEPVNGLGDGDTSPDAVLQGDKVLLRVERANNGNGRVYRVNFTASDGQGGNCTGSVAVGVPKSMQPGNAETVSLVICLLERCCDRRGSWHDGRAYTILALFTTSSAEAISAR